jgi:hypothetical protein
VVCFNATTLWHFDAAEWAPSTASFASVWPRTDDYRYIPINRLRYRASACPKVPITDTSLGGHSVKTRLALPCDSAVLRPLGQLAIRGRAEPIAVFEPWPSDAPPTWREAYLAAYAILDSDVAHAAVLLQKLMAERPADLAVRRLAERLPPMRKSDRSPT